MIHRACALGINRSYRLTLSIDEVLAASIDYRMDMGESTSE